MIDMQYFSSRAQRVALRLLAPLAFFLPLAAFAHVAEDGSEAYYGHMGMMGGAYGFGYGWVTMILFWIILVLLIVALLQYVNKK